MTPIVIFLRDMKTFFDKNSIKKLKKSIKNCPPFAPVPGRAKTVG